MTGKRQRPSWKAQMGAVLMAIHQPMVSPLGILASRENGLPSADHAWVFRGCGANSIVNEESTKMTGRLVGNVSCSPDGLRFYGDGGYADLGSWKWGGSTTIEVVVKFHSFQQEHSRLFSFESSEASHQVFLNHEGIASSASFHVLRDMDRRTAGRRSVRKVVTTRGKPYFEAGTWVHAVVTVDEAGTMSLYRDGHLVNGHEGWVPLEAERKLLLGRSILGSKAGPEPEGSFDGTVASFRVWHGVALGETDVAILRAATAESRFRASAAVSESAPRWRLQRVEMLIHIPKTAGSSVREVMPAEYTQRFPFRSNYFNSTCGVRHASTFHLTLGEMRACGIAPVPGPTLCIVRDPRERFESEVRWRSETMHVSLGAHPSSYVETVIDLCLNTRLGDNSDTFAHCRPQADYLYTDRGEPTCDYLLSDPDAHASFIRAVLGASLPHRNKSSRDKQTWRLTRANDQWLRAFYRRDLEDPNIKFALEGKVMTKRNGRYVELTGAVN